jgi:hypothetical protein
VTTTLVTVSGNSGTSSLSQNVFCFDTSAFDPEAVASSLNIFYIAWCLNCPSGANFSLDSDYREVNTATGQTIAIGVFGSGDLWTAGGTGGGTRLPDATAVLVRWRSGQYVEGKPVNGRTYLPYGNTGNGEGGVNGTTQAEMNTAGANFIGSASSFVVWSRTHGQQRPVLTASTWSEYAVQRRRRD